MSSIRQIIQLISDDPTSLGPFAAAEWDEIAITAIALGLAPLLHWHLTKAEQHLPPMTLAKLAVTRKAHAQRNQHIALQLTEILKSCDSIDLLILKGALLAPLAYPDPALRPMSDIDILLCPPDLSRFGSILEGLGYQGKYKSADEGPGITKHLSTYRRAGNEGATPNPFLSAGADRMIEPHGSLEESWFGLKVDITPGVWERAIPITLHDQLAYRLSTPDMILHLAVHATFHVIMGRSVFLQLYDIGQVIATWPQEVDWNEIVRLTHLAQAQPFLYAGLYWAEKLFQAPIPSLVLDTLKYSCSDPLLSYIHSLDAEGLFQRSQQSPLNTLKQRLQQGVLDRRETARWATSLRAKWQVWQTALAFYKTDTLKQLIPHFQLGVEGKGKAG